MALFVGVASGKTFDDGLTALPGEPEFTRAVAAKNFKDEDFNYVGTPNWVPPAEPDPEPAPEE